MRWWWLGGISHAIRLPILDHNGNSGTWVLPLASACFRSKNNTTLGHGSVAKVVLKLGLHSARGNPSSRVSGHNIASDEDGGVNRRLTWCRHGMILGPLKLFLQLVHRQGPLFKFDMDPSLCFVTKLIKAINEYEVEDPLGPWLCVFKDICDSLTFE
ncbi:hypothetical protein E3N88_26243 [Mikania micrantha]|uniref:Uncharacterized protein n=1 Tax=Mikania micrantha TaxID=192012 RepID=A0A5N6N755_9ASTR|nr:hypothetical protein E3N88_26243 [Mikania micrantha]